MGNAFFAGVLLLAASTARAETAHVSTTALAEFSMEKPFWFTKDQAARARFVKDKCASGDLPPRNNGTPFVARSASLTKRQNLIAAIIERIHADGNQVRAPSSTESNRHTPLQKKVNGEKFLAHHGLRVVNTPATGNCQYYAVAMALLDLSFDTPHHIEALERMTQHLKRGITEASHHGYEVEFPHDIRQAILVTNLLDFEELELPATILEEESDFLFQELIDAIAQSPSDLSAFLSLELWGTEVSLRMMTKLLQQPLFIIIASNGLQTAPSYYQVYKPERIIRSEKELDSAEGYFISSAESDRWIDQLQQACEEVNNMSNRPIVLLYSNSHYSRVRPWC